MKDKIKEMFARLPRTEQLELLRELTSISVENNPVVEAGRLSQEMYGENIRFEISNVGDIHNPDIKAELITPWGVFTANGINQKIAKAKAAEIALNASTTISEESLFDK
jgi:hypothetical protein